MKVNHALLDQAVSAIGGAFRWDDTGEGAYWCEVVKKLHAIRLQEDAERYRWLRSEEAATDPKYYAFWQEFNAKLCREGKMDAAIDAAMNSEGHPK